MPSMLMDNVMICFGLLSKETKDLWEQALIPMTFP